MMCVCLQWAGRDRLRKAQPSPQSLHQQVNESKMEVSQMIAGENRLRETHVCLRSRHKKLLCK